MIRSKVSRGIATAAASLLLLAGGAVATTSTQASAATVPNRYFCKPAGVGGGWCYQVNGAYNPSVGHMCHWKNSGMENKPHEKWYTSCTVWGPTYP